MRKQLLAAIMVVMLLISIAEAAFGSRNCDVNSVPFAVDVNKIYQPQFSGWRENVVGESLTLPFNLAGKTYIVECSNLPDGITCASNPPRLIGNFVKAGIYYSKFWAHASGSTIKTDFNQGVIVFKVYVVDDANLPYIEMICGN
jgi:hypothetical protein